ncbi:Uncharacterised protein [Mycoplasmopsis maculosa]|uniref:PQ loop repeat n=1 Tax=Mycoplasmopsis maculosa TaxID=114885 RepID=A0A449B3P6_9BACT|nr:PQ-loop domain-containing transporter [Mycoplasmopsis maculosa]VEU75189.1 Uncharacterised protein [Mycoplasmopsis maculosa]
MHIVSLIFGIISSIIMISISIPQIITTWKTKKVGGISYATFLIYFLGGFLFVVDFLLFNSTGTLNLLDPEKPTDLIITIIANLAFVFLMAITISGFFIFDKNLKLWFKVFFGILIWIATTFVIVFTIVTYAGYTKSIQLAPDNVVLTILTIIAGLCTALPFSVQIYKTIKAKSVQGLSFLMLWIGLFLNATIMVYLATSIPVGAPTWISAIVLQSIGMAIYTIMIILYFRYGFSKKEKNNTKVQA